MPVLTKRKDGVADFRNPAAHRHKGVYIRDEDDFYVEPRWCIEALLAYETFIGDVYDPCCGSGNIVEVLKDHGFRVKSNDIRPRYFGQTTTQDFLVPGFLPRAMNMISNPPFRKGLILPIIEKMIQQADHKAVVLVPAPFLYSLERHQFFRLHRPKLILHLSSRPSMPPGAMLADGVIKATGGKEDYAFVIFARDHRGPTICDWILSADAAAKLKRKQECLGQSISADNASGA